MSKEKKKSGRKSYLSDFSLNAAGEYIYTGKYVDYKCAGGRKEYVKKNIPFYIVLVVFLITAGCLPIAAMLNSWYVIIPYMLEVLSCAFLVYSFVKLISDGDRIREYVYKQTAPRIPKICLFNIVAAALCLIGLVIFSIINGIDSVLFFVLSLICKLVCISCSAVIMRTSKRCF
ncbi:MAG TPA: hypothetical protein GXZ23_04760 [Clostridiales bacterium]|nr:hypothetical protein [Clostridiales bacterium]